MKTIAVCTSPNLSDEFYSSVDRRLWPALQAQYDLSIKSLNGAIQLRMEIEDNGICDIVQRNLRDAKQRTFPVQGMVLDHAYA